jgi:serine/threonine protein kinase
MEVEPSDLFRPTTTQTFLNNETPPPAPHLPTFPEDEQIDWEALISVLKDITSGLVYIHQHGFVHRDLKPRNGSTPLISFLI